MTKDMLISNFLTAEVIIKYEILRYKMNYKQVMQNIYLDILPSTYDKELMTKENFQCCFKFFSQ